MWASWQNCMNEYTGHIGIYKKNKLKFSILPKLPLKKLILHSYATDTALPTTNLKNCQKYFLTCLMLDGKVHWKCGCTEIRLFAFIIVAPTVYEDEPMRFLNLLHLLQNPPRLDAPRQRAANVNYSTYCPRGVGCDHAFRSPPRRTKTRNKLCKVPRNVSRNVNIVGFTKEPSRLSAVNVYYKKLR